MMLPILVAAIFLVILGLVVSGLYFFVETPMARRQMRTRLAAVQQVALRTDDGADLLKKDQLSDMPWLNRTLGLMPWVAQLRLLLDQAAVRVQLGTFVLIAAAIPLFIFSIGLILNFPMTQCMLAAAASVSAPVVFVGVRRRRRLNKFEEQFPDAIDLLARSVRAGHAFTAGFEMIGKELPDPLGEEFRHAYRQQNLGLPLKDALLNMAVRVPSPDVRIFISALLMQREAGGNLGEILDMLSAVIRERFKLRRQVRIYTAEGRLSVYALSALPIVTVIGLTLLKPDYMKPMFTDPRGHTALAVIITLQIIGYVVLNRITKIKI